MTKYSEKAKFSGDAGNQRGCFTASHLDPDSIKPLVLASMKPHFGSGGAGKVSVNGESSITAGAKDGSLAYVKHTITGLTISGGVGINITKYDSHPKAINGFDQFLSQNQQESPQINMVRPEGGIILGQMALMNDHKVVWVWEDLVVEIVASKNSTAATRDNKTASQIPPPGSQSSTGPPAKAALSSGITHPSSEHDKAPKTVECVVMPLALKLREHLEREKVTAAPKVAVAFTTTGLEAVTGKPSTFHVHNGEEFHVTIDTPEWFKKSDMEVLFDNTKAFVLLGQTAPLIRFESAWNEDDKISRKTNLDISVLGYHLGIGKARITVEILKE
ncbi:hypothetical protein B0T24DRAFT_689838 [Lasiosphaeria ovina]|uniref:Uncharacterized protein n=1 Tax=Lasiosphaeria ovina TaxID=92902 RepID=A0AAE0NN78_9PEZI|nr:hypothetical protein B0T24DRAFT_689838 [Lasiosphaeria ovina]